MYSFSYLEPVYFSMSSSNCCFLTCIQVSQEAGHVVWYSHLFQNFLQFIVIHIVKGFGIVNKAEIDVFLELSCFFDDPADVGNLISGSSAFSKTTLNIWKFTVHILLKPDLENFEHYFTSMWDECNCVVVWAFFDIAFLWYFLDFMFKMRRLGLIKLEWWFSRGTWLRSGDVKTKSRFQFLFPFPCALTTSRSDWGKEIAQGNINGIGAMKPGEKKKAKWHDISSYLKSLSEFESCMCITIKEEYLYFWKYLFIWPHQLLVALAQ